MKSITNGAFNRATTLTNSDLDAKNENKAKIRTAGGAATMTRARIRA